jgi:RNA polymerase sigma-70 factor (ECF subfamily)
MRPESLASDTAPLVQRARAGDPLAWQEIDRRYRPILSGAVSSALNHRLGSRFDTEDVLQSTLLQAFESLDSFEYRGPGSFAVWLHTIAVNRLRDALRKQLAQKRDAQREVNHATTEHLNGIACREPGPDVRASYSETYLRMIDALQALDEVSRAVIHLREILKHDWDKIAMILMIPTDELRRIHSHAFGLWVKCLKQNPGD